MLRRTLTIAALLTSLATYVAPGGALSAAPSSVCHFRGGATFPDGTVKGKFTCRSGLWQTPVKVQNAKLMSSTSGSDGSRGGGSPGVYWACVLLEGSDNSAACAVIAGIDDGSSSGGGGDGGLGEWLRRWAQQ